MPEEECPERGPHLPGQPTTWHSGHAERALTDLSVEADLTVGRLGSYRNWRSGDSDHLLELLDGPR